MKGDHEVINGVSRYIEGDEFVATVDEKYILPELKEYLNREETRNMRFDRDNDAFIHVDPCTRITQHCYGIKSWIWKNFVPRGTKMPERSKNTVKLGSNAQKGSRTDRVVMQTVRANGKAPENLDCYSQRLLLHFAKHKWRLQAAQVPVFMKRINRVTQSDLVTLSKTKDSLIVWEVKTGYPPGAHRSVAKFKVKGLDRVGVTPLNLWYLQLLYTMVGLKAQGLPVKDAFVIQVWEEKNGTVKCMTRELPLWCKDYELTALFDITGKRTYDEAIPKKKSTSESSRKERKRGYGNSDREDKKDPKKRRKVLKRGEFRHRSLLDLL